MQGLGSPFLGVIGLGGEGGGGGAGGTGGGGLKPSVQLFLVADLAASDVLFCFVGFCLALQRGGERGFINHKS